MVSIIQGVFVNEDFYSRIMSGVGSSTISVFYQELSLQWIEHQFDPFWFELMFSC